MTTEHGIVIRRKKNNEIVDFIKTPYGNSALRVLSGVRTNLDKKNFSASEEILSKTEIDKAIENKRKKYI